MPTMTRLSTSLPKDDGNRRTEEQDIGENGQCEADDNPEPSRPFFVLSNGEASAGKRETQHCRDGAAQCQNWNADRQRGDYPEVPRQRILARVRRRAFAVEKQYQVFREAL